jgi:hypothetical protein
MRAVAESLMAAKAAAPAAGGAGSGRGGGRAGVNEVDADKLWRDRISNELAQQRSWHDEYGFMVAGSHEGTSARDAKGSGALGAQVAKLSKDELEELRGQLSKSTMRSTAQASFTQRTTPELPSTGVHNRRKVIFN